MNYPSVKRMMERLDIDRDTAKAVRQWMEWEHAYLMMYPPELPEATERWIDSSYSRPKRHEIAIHAIDQLIGTFGVEFISFENPGDFVAWPRGIEYCNAGDTYIDTVLYVDGRYSIGCWGDRLESWERRHGRIE